MPIYHEGGKIPWTHCFIWRSKTKPRKDFNIKNFPIPKNIRQLRGFLGLVGYYRRFIPQFAQNAKALTALLKLKAPYKWTTEQEAGFNYLKTSLISEPLLKYPNFEQPFILTTDASGYAMGQFYHKNLMGNHFQLHMQANNLMLLNKITLPLRGSVLQWSGLSSTFTATCMVEDFRW